jgi:hypothetical protein
MLAAFAFIALDLTVNHYLAVDRLIIGSLSQKYWKRLETVANREAKMRFTRVGIGTVLGSVTTKGTMNGEPNNAGYVNVGNHYSKGNGVLFNGAVSIPRKVKVLANANSTYLEVTRKFLVANGVHSSPRVTRIVSVDLDGDGTQEIIIESSNRDNLTDSGMTGVKEGDYSLVLLRCVINDKVVETPIAFDHPKPDGLNYINNLRAIADFDGDGKMEVVTSGRYYEGQSASLFRFNGKEVIKLVEMGDGV